MGRWLKYTEITWHTNPNTQEAEAGGLKDPGQINPYNKSEDVLGYIVKACFKQAQNQYYPK